MTNFLIKLAKKNAKDAEDERRKIGSMASIIGIGVNLILSIIKLIIGLLISSLGVIADAFNNITDTVSSIITLVSFNLADLPPDKEHPYGHGRIEYIAGLIVAFIVMLVGFQFIISSVKEIIHPKRVRFEWISFIILSLSIFFKLWLGFFNKHLSEKINSKGLKALSLDALGDVLTTTVVVVSLVVGNYTSLPIDGYIGIVVSLLIIYNGYNIVKETISPLIGESASKEVIKGIKNDVLSYDYITGTHDLFIHSYGENKTMAVIDVEFPASLDIVKVYDEITRAERELGQKYNMTLIIHMDPLEKESDARYNMRKEIKGILTRYPLYKSMHAFNIFEEDGIEIVEFDMVVHGDKIKGIVNKEAIIENSIKILNKRFPKKKFRITLDIDYH